MREALLLRLKSLWCIVLLMENTQTQINQTLEAVQTAEQTAPEQITLDDIVTLGVVELLTSPEVAYNWLSTYAEELGLEVSEAQEDELNLAFNRTLDQLAIPFIDSLPETLRASYAELMEKRAKAAETLHLADG